MAICCCGFTIIPSVLLLFKTFCNQKATGYFCRSYYFLLFHTIYLSLNYCKRYLLFLFAPSAITIPSSTILARIALVFCGLSPENAAISAADDAPCCDIYSANIDRLSFSFVICRLFLSLAFRPQQAPYTY